MNKSLVLYYSKTGSNKYLAEKIAQSLNAEIEPIRPRIELSFFVLLFSAIKFSFGIHKIRHDLKEFDHIILIGPHYFGHIASPVRDFIRKYKGEIFNLYYATCCGSSDKNKEDKFGYATTFRKVKAWMGETPLQCEAFPIHLVVPPDKAGDDKAIMETRLSDENFKGIIQERLDAFVAEISAEKNPKMAEA